MSILLLQVCDVSRLKSPNLEGTTIISMNNKNVPQDEEGYYAYSSRV
jgi:hypothetical protein